MGAFDAILALTPTCAWPASPFNEVRYAMLPRTGKERKRDLRHFDSRYRRYPRPGQ